MKISPLSWACHVCEASNCSGQDTCVACGSASRLSVAEVAEAKKNLTANGNLGSDLLRNDSEATETGLRRFTRIDLLLVTTIVVSGWGFAILCLLFLTSGQLSPGHPGCCTGPYSETLHLFFFGILVAGLLVGFLRWLLWPGVVRLVTGSTSPRLPP